MATNSPHPTHDNERAHGQPDVTRYEETGRQFDLAIYTLKFRAPTTWDDDQCDQATTYLNDTLESALDAVLTNIHENISSDLDMVLEQ